MSSKHPHPPAIVETLARYECPKCGNNCQCGVPYVPKTVRVAEYDKANPGKSTRDAAADLGVSRETVRTSRNSGDNNLSPATVTGRDGKSYPAKKPRLPSYIPAQNVTPTPDLIAQAQKHLDKIVPLLRQMNPRERLNFRQTALQQMADAHLDNDEIKF